LCTKDKILYLEEEWQSVPLNPLDCISTADISNKIKHNVAALDLLVETLIREAKLAKNQDTHEQLFEIPDDFLLLVNSDILNSHATSSSKSNKRLWVAFGKWLGFEGKIKRREVRQHIKMKWQNLQHALDLRNKNLSSTPIKTTIPKSEMNKMIISARNLQPSTGFRYIINPECVVDKNNRTLLHLELLDNSDAITKATEAVNFYYHHTLKHPSHRSESFWKNFIEHFGVFTLNNLLPYTSSNTASSHNVEHLECVNKLLYNLVPLSNSVNQFLEKYYLSLYEKLSKLKWGPFAPRPFGVFPMIAINYNTISDYHWDKHDDPNSLCCLVVLGDFEGGELCFPQLKIIIPLRPGQILLFPSRLLLHGNFVVTKGIRHSVVYFVHSSFSHHQRNFSSVYDDFESGIERNSKGDVIPTPNKQQNFNDAYGLNHQIQLSKPTASQLKVPPKSLDCRRGCIGKIYFFTVS
jgi:hypothetical protein